MQSWRTVRVFVSSTFRDMHAERDYLARVVFPELRERCVKRQLHLVDLDLRWGVTEEEAEQGKVLEIILDEINRSRPFFIAILGERYGSVLDEVPEDVESAYPWLRDYHDHSLTALEIMHGVLRNPDLAQRSFFYFRDPKIISQIPESRRIDFVAENPEAARKLARLKNKILVSGRPVMENYSCRWDNAVGCLVDLDAFGRQVLEDLWAAICAEYPEEAPEADPLTIERQMHEAFVEERSRVHIGRLEEAARLTQYVQGNDQRPVVITGESGCGKSAFLANWYRQYAALHPDDFVLAYFIGASPDSANHFRLLRNMCEELKREFALKEEIPQDDKKLSEALAVLLVAASQGKSRIVIVLDALNQLLPLEAAHRLGWVLDYMPEKVRLVVSSLEGDCLEVLRQREAEEIVLPPLTINEQRQIVQVLLGEWGRKLDDRQMAALLAHQEVKKPLYLRVALQELRLFGIFEQLKARIEALAEDIPGLFDQVLERLEEDHGRELVEEAFSLLGCSRYGLSEAELLDLLSQEGGSLPRALWARLARNSRTYLVQCGEFLSFFHQQMGDAVATRYLSEDNKHAKLATYFEHGPLERKLDEYPYQLQHSEQWKGLAVSLSDLSFFQYACDHGRKHEWMGYWQSLKGRFKPALCYRDALESKEIEEGANQHVALLLDRVSSFLRDMGLYAEALPFGERALSIKERILKPDHPEIASSLKSLAYLYYDQGDYKHALPLLDRAEGALRSQELTCSPDQPESAKILISLAEVYGEYVKYDDALSLYQRALAILERVFGPDHPNVSVSLHWIAEIYQVKGKFNKALHLSHRALAINELALKPNAGEVRENYALLYRLYRNLHNLNKSAFFLNRWLRSSSNTHTQYMMHDIRRKIANTFSLVTVGIVLFTLARLVGQPLLGGVLVSGLYLLWFRGSGTLTPWTLFMILVAFASSLVSPLLGGLSIGCLFLLWPQGKWITYTAGMLHGFVLYLLLKGLLLLKSNMVSKSKDQLEAIADLGIDSISSNYKENTEKIISLAKTYKEQGRHAEALYLYQLALSIQENSLSPDHDCIASTLQSIAAIYCEKSKYALALPNLRRALTLRERSLGPHHPNIADLLTTLATAYEAQKEFIKSAFYIQRALISRGTHKNWSEVASALNETALEHCHRGNYGMALSVHKRALEIRKHVYGRCHRMVAQSLNNIGLVYYYNGQYRKALALYKRALSINERSLGSDAPEVATNLNNIGEAYRACGDYVMALPLLQRSLEIREHIFGNEDIIISESLNNLGGLHFDQGQYDEALLFYERALSIKEHALPHDNPDIALALHNIGDTYRIQGKYAEAYPLLEHAVRIAQKATPNHPYTEIYKRHLSACRDAMR